MGCNRIGISTFGQIYCTIRYFDRGRGTAELEICGEMRLYGLFLTCVDTVDKLRQINKRCGEEGDGAAATRRTADVTGVFMVRLMIGSARGGFCSSRSKSTT